MTQVDFQQHVGLSSFFKFFIRFGSLSFFMWWLLLALLSPLWGWYIWEMSESMVDRAQFMTDRGLAVSPSIEIFKNIGWTQILGAGSLLGFLFYALPIALVVSLFESLARSFQRIELKWMMRFLGMLWIATPLGLAVKAFCPSNSLRGLIVLLCMLCCALLAKLFEYCYEKAKPVTKRVKALVIVLMILSVSHFLTHPVLHIASHPEAYSKINPMTLVRDWLLLDKNSSHWVNSWYYNHTAIAMEREKITAFQPMVVGLMGLDQNIWKNRLSSFFAHKPRQQGTKIKFIELKEMDDIENFLQRDYVHFIALDSQFYEAFQDRVKNWPTYSYAFFGIKQQANIAKEIFYTPQNYYGKSYTRWGDRYKETPVLKRKEFLQDRGLNETQSNTNTHFKRGLGYLLSHPNYLLALLGLLLFGALVVLFRVMVLSSRVHLSLVFLVPLLMSYYWIPGLVQNFIFWTSDPGVSSESHELRILALNELVLKPDPKKLEPLVNQEISNDLRVAKWQVACMGTIYKYCNPELKAKAIEWLQEVLKGYHDYPFGFRYKMIESSSKIQPLYDKINKLSQDEKHIYVRWYAENFGLGI